MLSRFFVEGVPLGLAQAVVVASLALLVMLLARGRGIHLERETLVALARGLLQIVAVGSVLLLLLQGPVWLSIPVLLIMLLAAASIAARRAQGIPNAFVVSLVGISGGAGLTIVLMTLAGVIEPTIDSLIPVGSIVIANAMNTNSLALDRFRAEVASHVGQVETALALGAAPNVTVAPYVQSAVHASLIPRLDSLSSLGIVWIPGLMAGMILSGEDPIYAAIYQFVVIAMIFCSAGLTSLATTLLIRRQVFSAAHQLILRDPVRTR